MAMLPLRRPSGGGLSSWPMVVTMSSYASEHPDMALEELAKAGDEPLTAEDHISIAQVHALLAIAAEMAAQRDIQQAALRSE
jgi:hypothetical protein